MLLMNGFGCRVQFGSTGKNFYSLQELEKQGYNIARLPFSIKILIENLLRNEDGKLVTKSDVENIAKWNPKPSEIDIPFIPSRVLLQDFTGVPCIVDLCAMRDAAKEQGADPKKINPIIPVDLVIDHSVQVDFFGTSDALVKNVEMEYSRNRERYSFLRWAQKAFRNLRIVPPNTGIVHQVNLEYLATVVTTRDGYVFPDTLIGTDSHTTMINGLGVLGWGVGGIEAEAAMLGQPMYMLLPEVVGVKITGEPREGTLATDLVLTVTQLLRKKGVVGKFVEFYGSGLSHLGLADKATIANMAPEYGATMGFFPVDDETCKYLKLTGRDHKVVEAYCKEQGIFRTDETTDPIFSDTVELDLSLVEPSLAGPKRPQDRVPLHQAYESFKKSLVAPISENGFDVKDENIRVPVKLNGATSEISHGSIVIASITSCTNTSNPSVMIAAGLVAKKAVELGLEVPRHVKTSLAPGSRVVIDYLSASGLLEYLEKLNFHLVGFGCTTCIGNSGPLPEPISNAIAQGKLVSVAILSGNRNFEGRINPHVKAAYLASPPLVVAFALCGTMDKNIFSDSIGTGRNGKPVYFRDIWPTTQEIKSISERLLNEEMFRSQYSRAFDGDEFWNSIPVSERDLYKWDSNSTYIRQPPYFAQVKKIGHPDDINGARVLALLGDSVTTDHISPAGSISKDSPAGKYLIEHGVLPADYNSYGSRRGNHEVMIRGTFANITLKNLLVPNLQGGFTVDYTTGQQATIYDASQNYQKKGVPTLVLAGKEYGSGSSRDWAAKGPALLGVKAVIAESFERIHRSNLVGMGVLPLQFQTGMNAQSLKLDGTETFNIREISSIKPKQTLNVLAIKQNGEKICFTVMARIDTAVEVDYYINGGILQTVLDQLLEK